MINANVNGTINYGQTVAAVTATPLSATSKKCINGLIITALSTNIASLYIGDSAVTTATGTELSPGASASIAINDAASVYIIGNGTDKASYIGN